MAVYEFCGISKKKIPQITRYDQKPSIMIKGLKKSFALGSGVPVHKHFVKTVKCCAKVAIVGGIAFGAKLLLQHK